VGIGVSLSGMAFTGVDPGTHEPGKPRLLTPLYRHDQSSAKTGR
jgi:hypothetical protein